MAHEYRLAGKVGIVTGASRGIGRGCALALAEDGADVVVNYLTHKDEAIQLVREIEGLGRRSLACRADVSDRDQVAAMVDAAVAQLGRLDIMVANAYRSIREPFLEITVEGLQKTLDVTLFGVLHCCQLAARRMVSQGGGGKIVAIGSVHAEQPFAGAAAYNTAKFGIDGLCQTAALELAQHRINLNVIHPGWINTPGERKWYTEEQLREEGKKIPWGRLGTPRDIGRLVAFLASGDADYITGAVIRADGGFILGLNYS